MGAEKILVVEDEAIVATDIEQTLKEYGYEVTGVVDTAEEAINHVLKSKPDLVLMDIFLRGQLDGITAAKQLRDKSDVPVVFLTAHSDENILQRAMVSEPYGYILKPFETREIRTGIELALHRHRSERGMRSPAPERLEERKKVLNEKQPLTSMAFEPQVEPGKRPAKGFDVVEFLKHVEPFRGLPEAEIKTFAQACNLSTLPAMDVITSQGDESISYFIVVTGRVALVKSSASGRELIVELLAPGDVFDLSAAFEESPYPVTVRAQCESKILWIPKSVPVLMLEKHPELYRELVKQMSQRLKLSHDLARGLAHDSVELRIAYILSIVVPRFAIYDKNEDTYTLQMTRQELADLVGTSPETAIRITKAMERQGLLDLTKPGYIKVLDFDSIELMAET